MDSVIIKPARIAVARFDEGDDLLGALTACARKNDIKCGWFSGIGALKKLVFGIYDKNQHKKKTSQTESCFEILSLSGNITIKEGSIFIHAHISVFDEKTNTSFGGHLMEGSIIYPFAEVVIEEYEGTLNRFFDKKSGLWPIKF